MNQKQQFPQSNLLYIGLALIGLSFILPSNSFNTSLKSGFPKPSDPKLVELAKPIIQSLNGSSDGLELANLYNDLATLIEIDQDVIKNTEEVREANRLSGYMLKLNLKDKYPNLKKSLNDMVISYIGDENASLSTDLRKKSVDTFRALAWACEQGSR